MQAPGLATRPQAQSTERDRCVVRAPRLARRAGGSNGQAFSPGQQASAEVVHASLDQRSIGLGDCNERVPFRARSAARTARSSEYDLWRITAMGKRAVIVRPFQLLRVFARAHAAYPRTPGCNDRSRRRCDGSCRDDFRRRSGLRATTTAKRTLYDGLDTQPYALRLAAIPAG